VKPVALIVRIGQWRLEMTTSNIPGGIDPQAVRVALVCEALPENDGDYFYSGGDSLFVTNTIQAFKSAGFDDVTSIADIVKMGVYLTVAVKTHREGATVPSAVIKEHSSALEKELDSFPNLGAIILMGDVAIKSLNYISLKRTKKKAIPSGSTYKIRNGEFYLEGIRVFPSYLPTGRNFLIEKSKRAMVAEDIGNAFAVLEG